ncbi:hypothetical protein [Aeromicrobium sp. Sec7.5]|uniref:hypothetical protein n=1 Tax=Aeromicrobium sp. Sec7.5 TaxID=3121276 RepID=UPI002FE49498
MEPQDPVPPRSPGRRLWWLVGGAVAVPVIVIATLAVTLVLVLRPTEEDRVIEAYAAHNDALNAADCATYESLLMPEDVAFYEENDLSCDDWSAAQVGALSRLEFSYVALGVEIDGDHATLRAEERYRPLDTVTGERASEPETFLEIHRWVRYDGTWRFVEYFPD